MWSFLQKDGRKIKNLYPDILMWESDLWILHYNSLGTLWFWQKFPSIMIIFKKKSGRFIVHYILNFDH